MLDRHTGSRAGRIILAISLVLISPTFAQSKIIGGIEVPDCVPGATNCRANGGKPSTSFSRRCALQCGPTTRGIPSRAEQLRVLGNCLSLCSGSGVVTCPNGRRQPVGFNQNRC